MFTSLLSMLRCFCAGQQSFILTCVGVTCTLRRQRRTCRVDWMFLLNVLPQVITVESVWIRGGGTNSWWTNLWMSGKNAEHASSLTPDLLSSGLETVTSPSLLLPLQQLSVGDWAQHRVSSVNGQKHISMKRCTRRWSWKGEKAKFKSGKLLDFSIKPLSKLFSNASTCEHIFMYLCIHVDDEIISTNYRSAVR